MKRLTKSISVEGVRQVSVARYDETLSPSREEFQECHCSHFVVCDGISNTHWLLQVRVHLTSQNPKPLQAVPQASPPEIPVFVS
jgi:hypothetical protein